uniref:Interleukin 17 receptor A n=2 Tax=Cynoglossus semilaevis TaxID=244447 RepID=A0A3P8WFF3_CYNSE
MFLLYVNMDTVKCSYKTLLFILDQTIRLFLSNNLVLCFSFKEFSVTCKCICFPRRLECNMSDAAAGMSLTGALLLLWLFLCASLSSALRVSKWPPLNCSTQDLWCTVSTSNCVDINWLDRNKYTPSGPDELQVSVDTRADEAGRLQPVLVAKWKLRDDGSIGYLKATELEILVMSTNQNLCVRYSFRDRLPMRSPSGERWSWFADMVVLQPEQSYLVSVFNIPKPEVGHSNYDVSKKVSVPGCQDPTMRETQFCINRGSQWQSNIRVTQISAALAVSFSPDSRCEKYTVLVQCDSFQQKVQHVNRDNSSTLKTSFSLDKWPRSCCQFDVEIKPLFPQCGEDCVRHKRTLDICPAPSPTPDPPVSPALLYTLVTVAVVCVLTAASLCFLCRKSGHRDASLVSTPGVKPPQLELKQPPKVLVIYSQDHHLYRDIVLKLCAFLQAKCGTKVLVDLLDSSSIGLMGRIPWLEWQRQQLQNPCDKVLVLCSRGVQAKWRALCGQGRVMLREDLLSPTDDMLVPFLHLFLPDMHQVGMQGRYLVAYFDGISSDRDVPSVFDIMVRYKLMKHFEELFFCLLDIEKYQPDHVMKVEGIGGDEYFNCPSGKDLKNAIERFQAYQLENPDWFERECVEGEEEIMAEANLLMSQIQTPPVLECVPLIRGGSPVFIQEVEICENNSSVHVLTPELNPPHPLSLANSFTSVIHPGDKHQCPSSLDELSSDRWYPYVHCPQSLCPPQPVLRPDWFPRPVGQIPCEVDSDDSQLISHLGPRLLVPQNSLDSIQSSSSVPNMQVDHFPPSHVPVSCSLPVEVDEDEVLGPSGKGPNSGSDQGYSSKISSQHEHVLKENQLMALTRLQEELFQQNLRDLDLVPEGN